MIDYDPNCPCCAKRLAVITATIHLVHEEYGQQLAELHAEQFARESKLFRHIGILALALAGLTLWSVASWLRGGA